MKTRIVGFGCAIALCSAVSVANADPVTIVVTGGGMVAQQTPISTTITMTGAGTDISATATNLDIPLVGVLTSGPGGAPGYIGPIGPQFRISTGILSPAVSEMIGGTVFPAGDRLTGFFEPITVPFIAPTPTGDVGIFTTAFTTTGNLAVEDSTGATIASYILAGGGLATFTTGVTRFSTGEEAYPVESVGLAFTSEVPSPTPEPAPVMLLAVGLLAVVYRRATGPAVSAN